VLNKKLVSFIKEKYWMINIGVLEGWNCLTGDILTNERTRF